MKKSFFTVLLSCLVLALPLSAHEQNKKSSKIKKAAKIVGYSALSVGASAVFLFGGIGGVLYSKTLNKFMDEQQVVEKKYQTLTHCLAWFGVWSLLRSSAYTLYKSTAQLKQLIFPKKPKEPLEDNLKEDGVIL